MDLNHIVHLATAFFPVAVYLVIGAVVATDLVDLALFKKTKRRWPSLPEYVAVIENDIADKTIIALATAAGLAYFATSGDKVGAAKAVFIAGCVANLALEENGLKAKLVQLFTRTIPTI